MPTSITGIKRNIKLRMRSTDLALKIHSGLNWNLDSLRSQKILLLNQHKNKWASHCLVRYMNNNWINTSVAPDDSFLECVACIENNEECYVMQGVEICSVGASKTLAATRNET
jgi:hypothetical protein